MRVWQPMAARPASFLQNTDGRSHRSRNPLNQIGQCPHVSDKKRLFHIYRTHLTLSIDPDCCITKFGCRYDVVFEAEARVPYLLNLQSQPLACQKKAFIAGLVGSCLLGGDDV